MVWLRDPDRENTDHCRAQGGECDRLTMKQGDIQRVRMLGKKAGEAGSAGEKLLHKPWPSLAKHIYSIRSANIRYSIRSVRGFGPYGS